MNGPLECADGDQFRLLADNAPVMIWRADASKACDFLNKPWLEFTGRTLEQELGFGWAEGVHPEDFDRCLRTYTSAFDDRQPFSMDYRLRRRDGAWRWVLDNGRPYFVGGAFAGYFGSCFDITEAKLAFEERRRAVDDRETLLAELHHRVKNNTQATTSFLALQASRAEDPAVASALRTAATRVMLASGVQDRMFRLSGADGVDLGPELADTGRVAMDAAGRPGIAFEARIEATLVVPVAQATPLALIVNELVTNAARHAFPAGRGGRVVLTVRRPAPGLGEVRVEDDGIGLPVEIFDRRIPRRCLGLHLVPRLARQARASFRMERPHGGSGTVAVVAFPAG
jgi:two-component system, sensor histidine kinase PdtaS